MVRHKRNGRPRHTDVLVLSTEDNAQLSIAVEQRFVEVCALHARVRKYDLVPPAYLDADMRLWRTMAVRHKKGDYRNTVDEILAIKRIAQWTLDVNSELKQQPQKAHEWPD